MFRKVGKYKVTSVSTSEKSVSNHPLPLAAVTVDNVDASTNNTEKKGNTVNTATNNTEKKGNTVNTATSNTKKKGNPVNVVSSNTEKKGNTVDAATSNTEKKGNTVDAATSNTEKMGNTVNAATSNAEKMGNTVNAATSNAEKMGNTINAATSNTEKKGNTVDAATSNMEKTGTKSPRNSISNEMFLAKAKEEFLALWHSDPKLDPPAKMEDFQFIQTIGKGSFGRVILVRHKATDEYLVTKVMDKTDIVRSKQVIHILDEKRVLRCIRNPFVIHLKYSFKDNDNLYLVLPFMSGGDLFTVLRKYRRFSEKMTRFYGAQVALGLEYLHYCGLVYRDLKPENIVMDSKGNICIADFGFCKMIDNGRTYTLSGTPEYIAPEVILTKGHGKAIDWWSYGVLLYEMAAGYTPFVSNNQMKIYENIVSGKVFYPSFFSIELKHLISNLLHSDLSRRYGNLKNGVNDIKEHRWFRGTDWNAILQRRVTPPIKSKNNGLGDTSNFDKYDEVPIKCSKSIKFAKTFEDF